MVRGNDRLIWYNVNIFQSGCNDLDPGVLNSYTCTGACTCMKYGCGFAIMFYNHVNGFV